MITNDNITGAATTVPPKERTYFKELLLANHFGTISGSVLKPKTSIAGNTTYEQLMCVGYQPQLKRLDAVVYIKQATGYSGGICTAGSQEYVKFFISTDSGKTWSEKGTVLFTVWDIPKDKPIEFDATLYVNLDELCCQHENLVLVRAILSWEVPPGGPNDPVVWGNSLDASIQVEPIQQGTIAQLIECLNIPIPLEAKAGLADVVQPIKFAPKKQLTPLELNKAYQGKPVPTHRYLLNHLSEFLTNPAALTKTLSQPGFQLFPGVEIDIPALIGVLIDPQGNETFEQIGCVGLNTNTAELVATVDVKLSSGYSGGLCTSGSQEYVAFWVDWEDGGGWQYVGTASVNVHDLTTNPAGGVNYSVVQPFPQLLTHRQSCDKGPKEAKIRAVLSWATPPSTTDPLAVPFWGGHAETLVLIPPGNPLVGGGPLLESIGSMPLNHIDGTGLASGSSVVGFVAFQSPFGGQLNFGGYVINPGTDLPGGPGYKYRLLTSPNSTTWTPVITPFTATTIQFLSGTLTDVPQTPDANGWCPYLAAPNVGVVGNILGYWESAGDSQVWFQMEAEDGMGNSLGSTVPELVQLDNTAPVSAINIISGGGSCGDFTVGVTLSGTYSASDNEALQSVGFSVEPSLGGGVFNFTPGSVTPTSQSGTWTLNTTGMSPCGYVIRMDGYDRTIVNSGWVGWDGPAFTGFCLRKP